MTCFARRRTSFIVAAGLCVLVMILLAKNCVKGLPVEEVDESKHTLAKLSTWGRLSAWFEKFYKSDSKGGQKPIPAEEGEESIVKDETLNKIHNGLEGADVSSSLAKDGEADAHQSPEGSNGEDTQSEATERPESDDSFHGGDEGRKEDISIKKARKMVRQLARLFNRLDGILDLHDDTSDGNEKDVISKFSHRYSADSDRESLDDQETGRDREHVRARSLLTKRRVRAMVGSFGGNYQNQNAFTGDRYPQDLEEPLGNMEAGRNNAAMMGGNREAISGRSTELTDLGYSYSDSYPYLQNDVHGFPNHGSTERTSKGELSPLGGSLPKSSAPYDVKGPIEAPISSPAYGRLERERKYSQSLFGRLSTQFGMLRTRFFGETSVKVYRPAHSVDNILQADIELTPQEEKLVNRIVGRIQRRAAHEASRQKLRPVDGGQEREMNKLSHKIAHEKTDITKLEKISDEELHQFLSKLNLTAKSKRSIRHEVYRILFD